MEEFKHLEYVGTHTYMVLLAIMACPHDVDYRIIIHKRSKFIDMKETLSPILAHNYCKKQQK